MIVYEDTRITEGNRSMVGYYYGIKKFLMNDYFVDRKTGDKYYFNSITRGAFDRCYTLEEVHIPNGIISIDDYAFSDCKSLHTIVIPESVSRIGCDIFSGCSNLSIIRYCGTKEQWELYMKVNKCNDVLFNTKIEYEYIDEFC